MRTAATDTPPLFSIVMATCRLGGMDITWKMLEHQTLRDIEFILVDFFYYERRELLAALWAQTGLPPERFIHVPPRNGCWEFNPSSGDAYNTGIALARGELVGLIGDYQYQYPGWAQDHCDFYRQHDGQETLAGDFGAYFYRGEQFDVERPENHLFSTFDTPFAVDPACMVSQVYGAFREPFLDENCRLPPEAFNATQNESVSLEALYGVNGLDEVYDGRRGFQDQDLGYRLYRAGYQLGHTPRLGCAIHIWTHPQRALPDGASAFGGPLWLPSGTRNADLLEGRKQAGFPIAALNGGFRVSDPLSVAGVLGMAESRKPRDWSLFCQLAPLSWRHRFATEPNGGASTLEWDGSQTGG